MASSSNRYDLARLRGIIRSLKLHGVPTCEAVECYIRKELREEQHVPASFRQKTWLSLLKPDSFGDDHLLIGVLSEMDFPFNTIVTPPVTSNMILSAALEKDWSTAITRIVARLKCQTVVNSQCQNPEVTVLINITHNEHWGSVIATKDGSIYWADSLGWKPFGSILEVVRDIMVKMFPNADWLIRSENDMNDILGYQKQLDGYSCGFYVISMMMQFEMSTGIIYPYGYEEYSADTTKKLRSSAIKAFFMRVEEVYMEKGQRTSEIDILTYITNNRMRFSPEGSLNKDFRLGTDGVYEKYGQKVEIRDKYVIESWEKGEKMYGRKTHALGKNRHFSQHKTFTCPEEKRR